MVSHLSAMPVMSFTGIDDENEESVAEAVGFVSKLVEASRNDMDEEAERRVDDVEEASPVVGPCRPSPSDARRQKVVDTWRESLEDASVRQRFIKLLGKIAFFVDTTEGFRSEICGAFLPKEYAMGQTVFCQGERGDYVHRPQWEAGARPEVGCLRARAPRICKNIQNRRAPPGSCVGELGLLGISETRSVTVVALVPTTLLILHREDFHKAAEACGGIHACAPSLADAESMQNLMLDCDSICNLECFKRLDRGFVEALCKYMEPRLYYPDQCLMREHAYGDELFLIQCGLVIVEKGGRFLVKLSGGVVLGELAVLSTDKRRTATVTAVALSLVHVLCGDVFHSVLDCFPNAKRVFDHAYIARLVSFELSKVRDEINQADKFYGRAHPMTTVEMMNQVYGNEWESKECNELRLPPLLGAGRKTGVSPCSPCSPSRHQRSGRPPGPTRATHYGLGTRSMGMSKAVVEKTGGGDASCSPLASPQVSPGAVQRRRSEEKVAELMSILPENQRPRLPMEPAEPTLPCVTWRGITPRGAATRAA